MDAVEQEIYNRIQAKTLDPEIARKALVLHYNESGSPEPSADTGPVEGFVKGIMKPAQDMLQQQVEADPLKDTRTHKAFRYAGETAMNAPESAARVVDAPLELLKRNVNPETGVLNVPGAAWDTVSGLAKGAVNIIAHPFKSVHDDPVGTALMYKGGKAVGRAAVKGGIAAGPAVAKGVIKVSGKMFPEATQSMGKRFMRSSFKAGPKETPTQIEAQTMTRLENRLPVSPGGVKKAAGRTKAVGKEIGDWKQNLNDRSVSVPVSVVDNAFDSLIREGMHPDELASIEASRAHFKARLPNGATTIPGKLASELAELTRKSLKQKIPEGSTKSYGQEGELKAATAVKEDLYTQEPGFEPPNKEFAALKQTNPKLAQELNKLNNEGVFPVESLTENVLKDIRHVPSNLLNIILHGAKIIKNPAVRSQLALKLWEAGGGKGPRPISTPPSPSGPRPIGTPPAPVVTPKVLGPRPLQSSPLPAEIPGNSIISKGREKDAALIDAANKNVITDPSLVPPEAWGSGEKVPAAVTDQPPAGGAAPVAPPQSAVPGPTSLDMSGIPEDLEIPITYLRGKTGKKITVMTNARQAYRDAMVDIEKIRQAMGTA